MAVGRRGILLLIQIGMGAIGFIAGLLHATIYPQNVLVAIMFVALAVATVAALGVRIGPGDRRPPEDPSAQAMAIQSETIVTVCYTLAIYNFLIAAGAGVLGGSPQPTVFGSLAGIFWIIAGLIQYHEE